MMRSILTGYEARGDRTMRASEVLQKCNDLVISCAGVTF